MPKSYVRFIESLEQGTPKTRFWHVWNTSEVHLGVVQWFNRWRQYVYAPLDETVYSSGCMREILEFVERANQEHRAK